MNSLTHSGAALSFKSRRLDHLLDQGLVLGNILMSHAAMSLLHGLLAFAHSDCKGLLGILDHGAFLRPRVKFAGLELVHDLADLVLHLGLAAFGVLGAIFKTLHVIIISRDV